MSTPAEKLAKSLEALKALQDQHKITIKSGELSRTDRERLLKHGFLKEVFKGWYISSSPDEMPGDSTVWYTSFWEFCARYLNERFSDDWCISPEQSVKLLTGNWTIPQQLMIRATKGSNKATSLLHNTSIFDMRSPVPSSEDIKVQAGLRLYSLPAAIVNSGLSSFKQQATEMRAALFMIRDSSELLTPLLEGGHSVIAGRLAGAMRHIGRGDLANEIIKTMQAAEHVVREINPFEDQEKIIINIRERSPYVIRMQLLWQQFRGDIIKDLSSVKLRNVDPKKYLQAMDTIYVTDAYHSLSIEGYKVSEELIERVRSKKWNPETDAADQKHGDALAARGYWQSFQKVKSSISKILDGKNPSNIVKSDHRDWYLEMFSPCIAAGILEIKDLAGYRNGPVYIRRSIHVPPSCEAVRQLMPAYFELLNAETDPLVRVILGHFFFVYIHPYFDGNGRMGRFVMNAMLSGAGLPWTVIPVEKRKQYMEALEEVSVKQSILSFAKFIVEQIQSSDK